MIPPRDDPDEDHSHFYTDYIDEVCADRSQKRCGAAVTGHAQSAGKTAFIRKPADGGIGGGRVAEADAIPKMHHRSHLAEQGWLREQCSTDKGQTDK